MNPGDVFVDNATGKTMHVREVFPDGTMEVIADGAPEDEAVIVELTAPAPAPAATTTSGTASANQTLNIPPIMTTTEGGSLGY